MRKFVEIGSLIVVAIVGIFSVLMAVKYYRKVVARATNTD